MQSLGRIAAATMIDGRARGMPPFTDPMALDDVAGHHWVISREDLCLPTGRAGDGIRAQHRADKRLCC